MGLSCGVVCVILRLSVFDTIPECDRHTDRQTHDDGIYSIASRGKNYQNWFISVEADTVHSMTEKDPISGVHVSPGSAEILVRRGGIANHNSIA